MAHGDMFLSDAEMKNKKEMGETMLTAYLRLAEHAVGHRLNLYRTRPKMHLLHHVALCQRRLNPFKLACWMDEDGVKKWMRLSKAVHKRTWGDNILKRFMLGLRTRLDKALQELRS